MSFLSFFFYFQSTRPWVLPVRRWLGYLQRDHLHRRRQPYMGHHHPQCHLHPHDCGLFLNIEHSHGDEDDTVNPLCSNPCRSSPVPPFATLVMWLSSLLVGACKDESHITSCRCIQPGVNKAKDKDSPAGMFKLVEAMCEANLQAVLGWFTFHNYKES